MAAMGQRVANRFSMNTPVEITIAVLLLDLFHLNDAEEANSSDVDLSA